MSNYKDLHIPCPDCGSSDGLTVYQDGSAYCFAGCPEDQKYKRDYNGTLQAPQPKKSQEYPTRYLDAFGTRDFQPIQDRGITVLTAKKYNALVCGDSIQFGYTRDKEVVAAKIRHKDKKFQTCGEWASVGLYGQELFSGGGLYLTIVEGEYDALSAFQMMGSKYPVVSIKNGASSASKDCKAQYKWIDSFKNIIIAFDMDEPGQEAAKAVAELFAGKSKIVRMRHKDASDYLQNNEVPQFNDDWWKAEPYVPDNVLPSSALYEEVMKPLQMPFCSYPWDCLNLKVYGLRYGEIVTILAGSGVGKSTFTKEILREVHNSTENQIGVLSLEETAGVAAMKMMSMDANRQFHLPTQQQMREILKDPSRVTEKPFLEDVTEQQRSEEKEKAFESILSQDRFMFLEHSGHITMDSVLGQMRYLSKAQNCKVILLDHISILVGLVATGKTNEREAIDQVMHKLRKLVEETNICLINISHLRKPSDGVGHEEGRRVQASEARGSGAIVQLSDIGLALEANRQSDDVGVRNQTLVRVLKNRFSGETGVAGTLQYDIGSGRLTETVQEAL